MIDERHILVAELANRDGDGFAIRGVEYGLARVRLIGVGQRQGIADQPRFLELAGGEIGHHLLENHREDRGDRHVVPRAVRGGGEHEHLAATERVLEEQRHRRAGQGQHGGSDRGGLDLEHLAEARFTEQILRQGKQRPADGMIRHRRIQRFAHAQRVARAGGLFDHGRKQRDAAESRALVPCGGIHVVAGKPDQAMTRANIVLEDPGLLGGDVGDIIEDDDVEFRQIPGRQVGPRHRLHVKVLLSRTIAARLERRRNERAGPARRALNVQHRHLIPDVGDRPADVVGQQRIRIQFGADPDRAGVMKLHEQRDRLGCPRGNGGNRLGIDGDVVRHALDTHV